MCCAIIETIDCPENKEFSRSLCNAAKARCQSGSRRLIEPEADAGAATPGPRGPPCTRRLCSRFDEQRDSDEGNNYQRGTSDEHITDIISCGARSHSYLVVISDDWTFVRIHASFLGAKPPIAENLGTPRLFPRNIPLGAQLAAVRRSSYVDRMTFWHALTHIVAY
jgi:hypothetical protein